MTLTKSNALTFVLVLVAFFGVALGGTVHKVGDSNGWTMGENYQAWASSKKIQVGDSLLFVYNNAYHDVNEVTLDNFEVCEPSNPLARYQNGSDVVTLTKSGVHNFICGFPNHCNVGQKLQVLVLPASLGRVAAPILGPVQSPSSFLSPSPSPLAHEPVNHSPQYQIFQIPTLCNAASDSKRIWIGISFLPLLTLLILLW